jgi:two-component sensor histidine kinase/ribosomal protein L22
MTKYLFFLTCCFGLIGLPAQSRLDVLLSQDPVFASAMDSLNAGSPHIAVTMLNQAKAQFKVEEKWGKYAGSLLVLGKIYFQQQLLDSALLVLHEALAVGRRVGNERLAANTEEGMARIYMAKREYPQAMQHYRSFAKWCLVDGIPKAKVETCLQMIQIYTRSIEPDSILRYMRLGQSFAKGHNFPVLQYKLNQLAGIGWNNWGRPDSALFYYYKSLALLEQFPKDGKETNVYLSIAHVFLDNHNPKRARKYLDLARKSAKESTLPFLNAMILYYEGLTLTVEKKDSVAVVVLEKALKAFKKLPKPEKHQLMQARSLKALAEAHHGLGNDEKALSYLRHAKTLNVKLFKRYNEMQSELMEAAILSEQDAISASDELLMENLVWAKKSANLNYQIKVYETLAANARKNNNLEKAMIYLDKANALKEKMDPLQQASLLSNSELAKEEQSVQKLETSNFDKTRRLRRTQIRAGIVVLVLLGFTLASIWFYRRKRAQAAQLAVEKQQVEVALQEKELLLKEIHHRVKNNMQVISSLLNLQSRGVQDPVALKVMRDGRDRVRSMALIHQTLYQNNDFSNVATADYFHKLAENLFHTYNIDQQRVQLVSSIQPLKFNVDIMIALGLILNELISNTLKYAFPNEQAGEVRISLSADADQVELKVEDNGVGFPADFAPDTSRSIGFSLIHAFTQKLGGSLQLNNAEPGASASLVFPINNAILAA